MIISSNKEWSSQLWSQFLQLRKEAWKKFRTSTGFEPVTSRYRCDALSTELGSHWRWEQVNFGFICSRESYVGEWYIISLKTLLTKPLTERISASVDENGEFPRALSRHQTCAEGKSARVANGYVLKLSCVTMRLIVCQDWSYILQFRKLWSGIFSTK